MIELECGGCVRPLPGLGRMVKDVVVMDLQGAELAWPAVLAYAQTCGVYSAVPATIEKLKGRPVGSRAGFKQLPGLVFVVRQHEEPVMQPPRFEGAQEDAEAAGWREEAYGWLCPACSSTAHAPGQDDVAGFAGLDEFFDAVKEKK